MATLRRILAAYACLLLFGGLASHAAVVVPQMTFEEFADGATNVDGFYGAGLTWVNEQVFNSAGTPVQSPFSGPNQFITSGTAAIDNVQLRLFADVQAVPEPASLLLVVAALIGVATGRRAMT